jgi:hypothetical protein
MRIIICDICKRKIDGLELYEFKGRHFKLTAGWHEWITRRIHMCTSCAFEIREKVTNQEKK